MEENKKNFDESIVEETNSEVLQKNSRRRLLRKQSQEKKPELRRQKMTKNPMRQAAKQKEIRQSPGDRIKEK